MKHSTFINVVKQLHPQLVLKDTQYVDGKTAVTFTCPRHGECIAYPKSLKTIGCPRCHKLKYGVEEFGYLLFLLYKDEPIYFPEDVDYLGATAITKIRCHYHGESNRTNKQLLAGDACPECVTPSGISYGERIVSKALTECGIPFSTQKTFPSLTGLGGGYLRYDFYVEDLGVLIEYDGVQHERPVAHFDRTRDSFKNRKEHDRRKTEYARKNGYKLLRLEKEDLPNLEQLIYNL